MTYREVAKKLKKLGCSEVYRRGGGSHRLWRHLANDRMTTVPDWGSGDLKTGTLRAVIRQLGLDWNSFLDA